MDEPDKIG